MAVNLGVWCSTANLPTIARWEQAAAELGFRLRVTPVDLRTHSGMIPIAFNADDVNTGFAFEIRSDWQRSPQVAPLLGGRDVFAWFKCTGDEWTETQWSAVAFALACDGLFEDELGTCCPSIEEAAALAREQTPIPEPGKRPRRPWDA